ncbi:MAG: flagellar basal body P-ring formation protein FlgA [Synergistaceae bacterium]|nr:flagellar basal body P-ring formation protein FlgA [Synergistaceae bacterium]
MNGKRTGQFFLFFAAVLLSVLLAVAPSSGTELTLEMASPAVVASDPFTLADAATLTGDDELVRKAGAAELSLPPGGVLLREDILNALSRQGVGGIRLTLIMPPRVEVRLDDSLAGVIKRLSGWPWQVDAEPMGPVPPGAPFSPPSIAPGVGSVTLKYDDGAGGERALAVRLSWTRPAVVAARPVERGKTLTAEDLAVQTVRVLRSAPLASSPEEVLGKAPRRSLSAGEPIALNLLAVTPIIQRGDAVIITVRNPSFVIEVRGQALDGGSEGDLIRVRNLQSKNVIQAVVTAPGRVEVR